MAEFPETGETPYGPKVKTYIDETAAEAAADSTAGSATDSGVAFQVRNGPLTIGALDEGYAPVEEGTYRANADSALQAQIDALLPSGRFKGDWVAQAYNQGDQVVHDSGLWAASDAAASTDEPGVAAVWIALPVDSNAVHKDDPEAWLTLGLDGSALTLLMGADPKTSHRTELDIGRDGAFRDWVIERLKARMGVGASDLTLMDEWGILGQSNGTDSVGPFLVDLASDSPWILQWNLTDDAWEPETGTPWVGSGISREWYQRDAQAAGRRVGAIPCAVGGSGFAEQTVVVDGVFTTTSWDPTNLTVAVNLAHRARDILIAARDAAPLGSALKGIVWSQGEADRTEMDAATYAAHLDELIAWLRDELDDPTLPFIVTPFSPMLRVTGNTAVTDAIQGALEDTPRRVEYTAYALAAAPDDPQAAEAVHWSPDAQDRRGAVIVKDPDPLRASAYDCALLNMGRDITITATAGANTVTAPPGTFLETDLVNFRVNAPGVFAEGTRLLVVTDDQNATFSSNALPLSSGTYVVGIGAPPRSVPGLKISRSGDQATITWGHPPTRVEEFILETCTDGIGTTWSAQTLTALTTHKHVMTAANDTPLWARIYAVSPTGTSYQTVEVRG